MTRPVRFIDGTLAGGAAAPGVSLSVVEKLALAEELVGLGVDVVEAGRPACGAADFEAVSRIAERVGGRCVVGAVALNATDEVDAAVRALAASPRARIRLVFDAEAPLAHLRELVAHAAASVAEVEVVVDDGCSAALEAVRERLEAAIGAGATVVGIRDLSGVCLAADFGARVSVLRGCVAGAEGVAWSVRAQNDLGLATAEVIEGVRAGADEVGVSLLGLGTRTGGAALEQVAMALRIHGEELGVEPRVEVGRLARVTNLASALTGETIAPNAPIVGRDALEAPRRSRPNAPRHQQAHAEGIDGTTGIVDPAAIGRSSSRGVLSARSGRETFARRVADLGFDIADEDADGLYELFLTVAERKRLLYDDDLSSIVAAFARRKQARWKLVGAQVVSGFPLSPTATVTLEDETGALHSAVALGTGPVDAVCKAIDSVLGTKSDLTGFSLQALTRGIDALGEVRAKVASRDGHVFVGQGSDADIVVSSARAYLDALNRLIDYEGEEGAASE